jgi:hypothetical protein
MLDVKLTCTLARDVTKIALRWRSLVTLCRGVARVSLRNPIASGMLASNELAKEGKDEEFIACDSGDGGIIRVSSCAAECKGCWNAKRAVEYVEL